MDNGYDKYSLGLIIGQSMKENEDKRLQLELEKENKKLREQLEEKNKIIDEIEKRCNQEISSAMIQYERHKRNDTWQYMIAHKRILDILERSGINE